MKAMLKIDDLDFGDWDGLDVNKSMVRYCELVGDELHRRYPDIDWSVEWADVPGREWRIWFEGGVMVGGEDYPGLTCRAYEAIEDIAQQVQEDIYGAQMWTVYTD